MGTACTSGPVLVAPRPPQNYEKLGHAAGSACGSMFVISTAYNFIPIMLSSRVARSYQRAVASVPGSTGLVNVTTSESWFWWVIGTTRCLDIEGDAIRAVAAPASEPEHP